MDQNFYNEQIYASLKIQVSNLPLFKVSFEIKLFIPGLGSVSVIDLE